MRCFSDNTDFLTGTSNNDTFFFDANEYQPLDNADGGDGVDLLAFNVGYAKEKAPEPGGRFMP